MNQSRSIVLPVFSIATGMLCTMIVLAAGYFFPDKAPVLIIAIPFVLSFFLFTWSKPHTVLLILVAIIPLDTFIYLPGSIKQLSLFKLIFPVPLLIFIIGIIIRRYKPLPVNTLDKWIIGWALLNIFLIPNSVDMMAAANFSRKFISMVLLYFLLSRFFDSPDRFEQLKKVIILSTLLSVIIGIFSYMKGGNPFSLYVDSNLLRTTGATGMDPNTYAVSLFLPMCFAVVCAIDSKYLSGRLFFSLAAAVIAAGVLITFSRSAFLVVALMICLALIIWYDKLTPFQWNIMIFAAIAGVFFLPDSIWERIASLGQMFSDKMQDVSLIRRSNYLKVGWNIFQQYPFLGAGPGNFAVLHAAPDFQAYPSLIGVKRMPHNLYLQVISETGITGLIFMLGVSVCAIRSLIMEIKANDFYKNTAFGLLLTIFGVLSMGIFLHMLQSKFFWIILALIRILQETKDWSINDWPIKNRCKN